MDYMRIFNDGEMVVARINHWDRYCELLRLRFGNKEVMADQMLKEGRGESRLIDSGKEKGDKS